MPPVCLSFLQVKCVLVGYDPHISYMKLIRAASYLKNPECVFLVTNTDSSFPSTNLNIVIPGMFHGALPPAIGGCEFKVISIFVKTCAKSSEQ